MKAHQDGNPAICNTLRLIPRLISASDEEILRTPVQLQEVQHALAREYGCKSWTDLLKQVETMSTSLAAREQCLLTFMRDILEVTQACATTTLLARFDLNWVSVEIGAVEIERNTEKRSGRSAVIPCVTGPLAQRRCR